VGGTERSPYPQLSQKLGLGDRVHFLGYRRDVPEIMKAVDLFVFPSRYEACTLVLLEAMASGLPVITAVTTGGAEIVTDDCGIVLSDSEDVSALADAMTKLANDGSLRKKMGQAARAIAEQHSWTSKANAYVDLFESMVS
jgi:glycosyltransferase involved in cell wall biosynthesis